VYKGPVDPTGELHVDSRLIRIQKEGESLEPTNQKPDQLWNLSTPYPIPCEIDGDTKLSHRFNVTIVVQVNNNRAKPLPVNDLQMPKEDLE